MMSPLIPPNLEGLDFPAYAALRQHLLASSDGTFLDAGETNLYRTLAQAYPDQFGPIAASDHTNAPYRCHLGEAFLDYLGLDHVHFKSRSLVSHGVRYSLGMIFRQIARSHQAIIPGDVYPVYGALAAEAGVEYTTYSARKHLPWSHLESRSNWCLLICDPVKPWGGELDDKEWSSLVELASSTQSLILVDGAYRLKPSSSLRACLDKDAPIAFLGSLSKGWLAPLRGGIVIASQAHADKWRPGFQSAAKNVDHLREAFAALTDYPGRPAQVDICVDAARARLVSTLQSQGISFADPGVGYFVTIQMTATQAFERGVLPIPSSVFGPATKPDVCIASALSQVWLSHGK